MALPSLKQATSVGLLRYVPPHLCPTCGKRPPAEGKILCHECRLAAGITEQMTMDEMEA